MTEKNGEKLANWETHFSVETLKALGQVVPLFYILRLKLSSDFENTDDEEEDWNDQVPPDEEEFDEIEDDDFSSHADHE